MGGGWSDSAWTPWRLGMGGLAVIASARAIRTLHPNPYTEPYLLAVADNHLPASLAVGIAWVLVAIGLVLHGVIRPGVPPRLYRLSLYGFIFLGSNMALAYLGSIPHSVADIDLYVWAAVHLGTTLLAMHMSMTRRRKEPV